MKAKGAASGQPLVSDAARSPIEGETCRGSFPIRRNPYLAFSAMLMAGLDGIVNKVDAGSAIDKDLYDLPPKELKKIPTCAAACARRSRARRDRAFLKAGDVFSDDFIDSYIELKMGEVQRFEMTPHPIEFEMYYSY